VVDDRELFMDHLKSKDIPTIIHYPFAISQTKIYERETIITSKNSLEFADKIVSIPIHPFMTEQDVTDIIDAINIW
jgi:UDP-2-acetamido-2-deoxy-ribo-hexuluronate aminotransferase